MAGNAGLVAEDEPVVVVAGTGRGADTALVMAGALLLGGKSLLAALILWLQILILIQGVPNV